MDPHMQDLPPRLYYTSRGVAQRGGSASTPRAGSREQRQPAESRALPGRPWRPARPGKVQGTCLELRVHATVYRSHTRRDETDPHSRRRERRAPTGRPIDTTDAALLARGSPAGRSTRSIEIWAGSEGSRSIRSEGVPWIINKFSSHVTNSIARTP